MADPITLSRRSLLQASGVTAAALALGVHSPGPASANEPTLASDPFTLGVASGAPRTDGMVLWTRLAPDPLAVDGHGGAPLANITVSWQVASDEEFADVVASGNALAQPGLAHAVHPRVTGLTAATVYFYRFTAGQWQSPTGRFRTLPVPGAGDDAFSFALASCQAWYHGHFTAYKHMLAEPDLDLVVFVGDYIYEYAITAGTGGNLWREGVEVGPEHGHETETLRDYRLRYSLFKSDPHLQAIHARVPMINVWDDHEVENNYVGGGSAYGLSDEVFAHRIAVAYRAFYENLPLDLVAKPDGPQADITSGFDVGSLARFSLLDTRQFRDPRPEDIDDPAFDDPERTMLGAQQEAWVGERLAQSSTTWNLLVNGVTVAAITEDRRDQWDGFPAARQRLLDAMSQASNPVVLTGDIHKNVAIELRRDFASDEDTNVGVELICTSIASDGDGSATSGPIDDWLQHEYVKLYDGRRGYVHVHLTAEEMHSTFVYVDHVEADDRAPRRVLAEFVTSAGDPHLRSV